MTALMLFALVLIITGPTVVFYAAHTTGTVLARTLIAFGGFFLLVAGLWVIGIFGT